MSIERLEKAKDEAEAAVEKIKDDAYAAKDRLFALVDDVAEQIGASSRSKVATLEAISEALDEMMNDTLDAGAGKRLDEAKGSLETAEQSDLQKSAVR